jgi:hypothetical protein
MLERIAAVSHSGMIYFKGNTDREIRKKEFDMFWIIVLVIVMVIVVFAVKHSIKENKRKREYQEHMKDLEARAAAGDEAAKQELEAEKEAAKQKLIAKGASSFCTIYCTGGMPDPIVGITERKIKEAIAQNGGPGEHDWERTRNEAKKMKSHLGEELAVEYKSPKGDSIFIGYHFYRIMVGQYKDASTGRPATGPNSSIGFTLNLKMLPEIVQAIAKQVERELRNYLSSNGETFLE